MTGFLRRLFSPSAAAREEAEKLLASQPTPDAVLEFLKKRTEGDEAVRVIRTSDDAACKEAVQKWEKWCSDEWKRKNETTVSRLRTESQRYFASQKNPSRGGGGMQMGSIPGLGAVTFFDLRSDQEKQIEQDARSGGSIGPVFDRLVAEIIAIGRSAEFTVLAQNRTAAYDERCRQKRVHEIGMLLNAGGGMKLMQAAAYRVRASGGDGCDLDRCWDGIGQWRQ